MKAYYKKPGKHGKSMVEKLAAFQRTAKNKRPIEELREGYTPELREILAEMAEVAESIDVSEMVTATNYASEHEKWMEQALRGIFTVPELEYNRDLWRQVISKQDYVLDDLYSRMGMVVSELPDDAVGFALAQLTEARMQDLMARVNLAVALLKGDPYAAMGCVTALYGVPGNALVGKAMAEIRRRNEGDFPRGKATLLTDAGWRRLKAMKLDAEAIRRVFLWVAEQYGFTGTRPVVVSEKATVIGVLDASSEGAAVLIPTSRVLDGIDVIALAIHEVGCHWRDAENMQWLLPGLGAGPLKSDDALLREGYAVTREDETRLSLVGYRVPGRALYYPVAIDFFRDREKRFDEVAERLYGLARNDWQTPERIMEDVWLATYRTARGNPRLNVRNGYAFTRERCYFGGRILVKEMRQVGVEHLLAYNTLSLSDLKMLAPRFNMRSEHLPYPEQPDMAQRLCEKLLRSELANE